MTPPKEAGSSSPPSSPVSVDASSLTSIQPAGWPTVSNQLGRDSGRLGSSFRANIAIAGQSSGCFALRWCAVFSRALMGSPFNQCLLCRWQLITTLVRGLVLCYQSTLHVGRGRASPKGKSPDRARGRLPRNHGIEPNKSLPRGVILPTSACCICGNPPLRLRTSGY